MCPDYNVTVKPELARKSSKILRPKTWSTGVGSLVYFLIECASWGKQQGSQVSNNNTNTTTLVQNVFITIKAN